jgi:hypothetical protein
VTAEYIRAGKTHQVEIASPPPPQIVLTARACPKSPVFELTLEYVVMSVRPDVALYRIAKERALP